MLKLILICRSLLWPQAFLVQRNHFHKYYPEEKKAGTNPGGGPCCDNVGFCLPFGRDVGQHQSNTVTMWSFRHHCSDQNLTLLRLVFDVNFRLDTCFLHHFSDKSLTVYQRYYDSLFPKLCKWSFNFSFW